MGAREPLSAAAPVAVVIALAGCAVGPDFKRPEAPAGAGYGAGAEPVTPGGAQTFDTTAKLRQDWWRLFGSPKVDALVAYAFTHSPTSPRRRRRCATARTPCAPATASSFRKPT